MSTKTMLVDPEGKRYLFDAVFSAAHSLNVAVTSHTVQTGAAVADHAYVEPETVSLSVGMSDVMTGADSIAGNSAERAVSAYRTLRRFAIMRKPLTLVTRLCSYEDMLIETVAAEETADTMHALRAEITLRRLNMVSVAQMSVQQTAASGRIAYESARTQQNAGYIFESYGGTQSAGRVEEGSQLAALLIRLTEGGN